MIHSSDERRLLRAIGNLCNDTLKESEGRWLAQQLRESPAMRDLYVDYMSMHANISSEVALLNPMLSEPETPDSSRSDAGLATPHTARKRGLPSSRMRSWLFMAASLLLVFLLGGALSYSLFTADQPLAQGSDANSTLAPVARVTSTQNCRWGDSDTEIGYGSELRAGQEINLREGLAELTFADGATMLLESPATLVFESADKIEIREGRLAARVPPESSRLSIHTKTLNLRNVDAEFGLLARETGASELHVFTGSLEANFLDAAGKRREQMEVRGSEAVRTSASTTTIYEFPANATHFVRTMTPTQGPHDGLLAYEGFIYPEGPLTAQNGGFGWAGPWSTIAADRDAGPDSNSVSARSLSASGMVPRGNHAAIVGHQNRIRRTLATSIGGVFDVAGLVENRDAVRLIGRDGTTLYVSFLQRVDNVDDGFYGVELHRGDGNHNRVLCLGNGADETGYGVTSAVNVYGKANFPSLGREDTAENLFVLKFTFGSENRDTVEVFRNPASLRDEQKCIPSAVLKGNFAFDRISLANFHGSKIHEVDELRIGTHFLAVTGRWGGERGRLLRGLTQLDTPTATPGTTSLTLQYSGNSRNLLPLGVIAY